MRHDPLGGDVRSLLAHDDGGDLAPPAVAPPRPEVSAVLGDRSRLALVDADQDPASSFTSAEIRVLEGPTQGLSAVETAERLDLSHNTRSKTHIQSIYRKAGVHKRSQAVEIGRSLGLDRRRAPSSA